MRESKKTIRHLKADIKEWNRIEQTAKREKMSDLRLIKRLKK